MLRIMGCLLRSGRVLPWHLRGPESHPQHCESVQIIAQQSLFDLHVRASQTGSPSSLSTLTLCPHDH